MIYKIKEICRITKGETGIMKAVPGEYPLVALSDVRKSHNAFQFNANAVIVPLISSTGHGHASMKRVHYQEGKFALGNILCAVIPKDENQLNAKYLHIYLQQFKDSLLVPLMKGMANVSLPIGKLADVEIEVPDLDKQIAIIGLAHKADNIKSKLEEKLTIQENDVKQLRQAFLREAMQGKLVAQDAADGNAATLLQQIKAEKEKLVAEKKLKKDKPLLPIKPEEIPFDIPENWVWCRLGNVVIMGRGKFSIRPRNDPSYFGGEHPFIQIGSLDDFGSTINSAPQTLNDKGAKVSKKFPKGTILIAIVGGTIGNLGVLGTEMFFTDSIVGIRPNDFYNQNFILNFLRLKQPEIRYASYQMAGQPNIKIPTLENLLIPLPPLAEQQRIVQKLDELMHLCDSLQASIQASRQQNDMLLQVALKEALSGGAS